MLLLQLLDANVAKPHLERFGSFSHAVHLQGDETGRRDRVGQLGRGQSVEPGLDCVAFGLDAKRVPGLRLEGVAGRFVVFQVGQPATASFIVDAPRPGPREGSISTW